jgi:predicted ATPase/class 3 adenylate cyclase
MAVFCFTDIEGSTEKWEKYKSVMGQVIARHNQILETAVPKFGGRVIKNTGDGIYAIFDAPLPSLQCALVIQKAIQAEPWPGIGELRVRMAFHCGDAEKIGEDYIGAVANRTARLMSLGWGGQILVSEEMKKLGALPEGASFVDLGVHQVKDLPEPQQVYGLVHPDLKLNEFPALKSLSRPVSLPPQLTPFVGREKELAQLGAFFAAANHRLLTLRGSGGMGKTRLAIQAGLQGSKAFKHGVYFVALEALTAPEQLLPAIAAALKLPLYGNEEPKAQLLKYLSDKELLLILDNFDHLLASAAVLSEILLAAPHVKILATSRAKLNHNSESVLEIQGLDTQGSVTLFLQRARKVKSDFALKKEEQDLLLRICAQLEGMPLGLELAAAWVKTLSVQEVCRRLETSIALLVSLEKDLPERQRSMRALFDYSWKFLNADEQRVFRNLSVFVDGFSGEAAEAVAQCNHAGLNALVNKSLLKVGDDGRYQVQGTLRQFAKAKLDGVPADRQKIQDMHCQYYVRFLKAREAALRGTGQVKGLAEVARDFGNIQQAWKHAVQRRLAAFLGLGARCLGLYVEIMSLGAEWQPLFEQALALWAGSEQTAFEGVSREEGLKAFAVLTSVVAEVRFDAGLLGATEAATALQKSVQVLGRIQAKDELAFCLVRLCTYAAADAKVNALNEAASIYRLAADRDGEAWAKALLGQQLWTASQDPQGKRMLADSQAVFKELGNIRGEAGALQGLGAVALQEGKPDAGIQLYRQARDRFATLGDLAGAGWAMLQVARFFTAQRAWAEARPFAEESLEIFASVRHARGMQAAFQALSEIYWSLGNLDQALANADRALAHAQGLKDGEQPKARAFMDKAGILQRQGNFEEALALSAEGLRLMQSAKDAPGTADAMEVQGDVLLAMGQAAKARELYKSAHLGFGQLGEPARGRRAWTVVKMADAEQALGQATDAKRNYGRALKEADASGAEDFAAAALKGLALSLGKEKMPLDALKLLLACDRIGKAEKLKIWNPRDHARAAAEGAKILAESVSKLLQGTVDENNQWVKSLSFGQFLKETVAKYCA